MAPQALPQLPQLSRSLCRLTQAPSQGEYPAEQAMPQLPPWHTATPFEGVGQALPQAPQLAAEV